MKTIIHLLLISIFSLASVAQAESTPHCWDLSIPGFLGVSSTRLQLFGFDEEARQDEHHKKKEKDKKHLVSGTASFDIITFPLFTHTRLVTGSSTTVNNKIEISLHASEAENIPDSEQKNLWSGTYHLILDAATLNGIFLLRASEDDPQRTTSGEATSTNCV